MPHAAPNLLTARTLSVRHNPLRLKHLQPSQAESITYRQFQPERLQNQ